MRTYSFEKRHGVSTEGGLFSKSGSSRENGEFDFFEFLLSEGVKVAAPDWFAEHMESMRYEDGSYGLHNKAGDANTASDLYGTCYAVCAMKSLGTEPPKEAIDYIERLKRNDGSFSLGPDRDYSDMDTTHAATLALCLCGRAVPRELGDYVTGLRNEDGSYNPRAEDSAATLASTREALTILRAAGREMSDAEKKETEKYIRSSIVERGFENVKSCYDAVLSLNLMGTALVPAELETLLEQIEKMDITSEEESFKAIVIRRCICDDTRPQLMDLISMKSRKLMNEVLYSILARKLAAGGWGRKNP